MSRPVTTAPLMFVPVPGEGSVATLFQRLDETATAAVAEREGSTKETYAQNLFRRVLHQVIDIIAGPRDQERSVGIAWLSHGKNRVLFRQIVPAEDHATFFRAHLTNQFITGMLEDPGLLNLIPEADRTDFVRSVLGNWIPTTDAWITGALSAQISRGTLATAIVHWLTRPDSFEGGDAFAARFLRTGTGVAHHCHDCWSLPHDVGMWSLFGDLEDVWVSLDLCAQRVPEVFFEAPAEGDTSIAHKVQLWLKNDGDSQKILRRVIDNLKSGDGLPAKAFEHLGKWLKVYVIRRPSICPLPFLVKFALDHIDGDGYNLFQAYIGRVAPRSADYAADLVESLAYIKEAQQRQQAAPYAGTRIARIKDTLLRNAALHPGVKLAELDLT